ncbi:hypothetical protein HDR61_02830 [bacterium]|nr:hypothetical protein [bacterium]
MKEFIVNNRGLATVECDIPVLNCPVYTMLQQKRYSSGAGYVCASVAGQCINIGTVIGQTRHLKAEIMELCMNCNVKAR